MTADLRVHTVASCVEGDHGRIPQGHVAVHTFVEKRRAQGRILPATFDFVTGQATSSEIRYIPLLRVNIVTRSTCHVAGTEATASFQ
jgi:hypothetical protein